MQTWPQLPKREAIPAATAVSRSASASTMNGSEPPNSSTEGFSAAPANAATAAPARGEPVRVTPLIRGSSMIRPIASLPTLMTANNPSGAPASSQQAASMRAERMTLGAGLSRNPLPPSRIGTAARTACQSGKFHGMMASTTPVGRYETMTSCVSTGAGSSASIAGPCSAYHSAWAAHLATSARLSVRVLPISAVMVDAIVFSCPRRLAAKRRRTAARSAGVHARQDSKPRCAAASVSWMPCVPVKANRSMIAPVAGLRDWPPQDWALSNASCDCGSDMSGPIWFGHSWTQDAAKWHAVQPRRAGRVDTERA